MHGYHAASPALRTSLANCRVLTKAGRYICTLPLQHSRDASWKQSALQLGTEGSAGAVVVDEIRHERTDAAIVETRNEKAQSAADELEFIGTGKLLLFWRWYNRL